MAFLHDAAAGHLTHVLTEVADGETAIGHDLTAVRLFLPDDQTKHRGFAGTVRSHETDFLAAVDAGRRLHEEDLTAVVFADGIEANHGPKIGGRRPICKRLPNVADFPRIGA
jgi:hypothetical protein